MRDDPEVEVSVHAPVALGASALLRVPKLLHLPRRALAEHLRRNREDRKVALSRKATIFRKLAPRFLGLPLTLLVLLRIRVSRITLFLP